MKYIIIYNKFRAKYFTGQETTEKPFLLRVGHSGVAAFSYLLVLVTLAAFQ